MNEELIYGMHPVLEAIAAGKEIDRIFVQQGMRGAAFQDLWAAIKEHQLAFKYVPVEKLNRLTRKNHQGVIAFVSQVEYQLLDEIVPMVYERGETPLLLALDRVTDVRNAGAIARSIECVGGHCMIMSEKNAAPMNGDAVKSSAGALLRLPVCREKSMVRSLETLAQAGLQIIGITEKAAQTLDEIDFTLPSVLVMGSEEDGISPEVLRTCHVRAKIPMVGHVASLNVSVAAGMALYEALRQRSAIGTN
jgi:23S rRNA (guanosine2251-2'-O)-methyltransferase